MQEITIRPASQTDIPRMAVLWQEKQVVHQQSDGRFRLVPDAADHWSKILAENLEDLRQAAFIALRGGVIVGYILGGVEDGPPGFTPDRMGVVTDLAVELHRYQPGVSRALWMALGLWFREQGVENVIAHVPSRQPVAQAFWRSLGATEWVDMMWMKL